MRLLCALALAGAAFGQDVAVSQQVITNGSTAQITSGNVQNIGQPYHLVFAKFTDQPSKTCGVISSGAFAIPLVAIQASWDGVNFTDVTNVVRPLNPSSSGSTDRYRMLVSAGGNYPYVRVFVNVYDNANCFVNAWYTGGRVAVDVTKAFSFNNNYADQTKNTNIDIASSGTNTLLSATGFCQWAVYGLTLYNSTTSNTITLFETRTDSANVTWATLDTVAQNQAAIQLPDTGVPYYQTTPGATLKITTSGNGPVSGFITARCQ